MLFLRFPLLTSCHAPYLPHILTMGRDEILQPTRFKALKCNHPNKNDSLVLK
ncbi:hypothetical protein [Helicobacter pylori]|uniref:hypothetical protein n=1 Tax=Helicobacter pylori TaxID=210 RepID=UPI0013CE359A|nr:hypothetical protein [Helicobacter pylori]